MRGARPPGSTTIAGGSDVRLCPRAMEARERMTMRRRRLADVRSRVGGSRLGRAVLAIGGATMAAQLVAFAAAPVLTRLYAPGVFGAFFIINAVSMALAAGFALRLELAIPLPEDDEDGSNLARLGVAAITGMLLVVVAVSVLGSRAIASVLNVPGSRSLVLFIGPLAASFALFALFNAIAVRERRFGAMARRYLIVAIATVALQLAAGLVDAGASGLAVSTLIAQLLGAASLNHGTRLAWWRPGESRPPLVRTLRRWSRFPLVLAPAGWLNSAGTHAPLVAVGALYAADAAGWFGLTLRIVALPVALIGASVAQVYVSELASRHREHSGHEHGLFLNTSRALGIAAVLVGGLLFVVGPWAFGVVFGHDWAPAGDMARAYAVGAAAQILVSPISQTLIVYERVALQLMWDASRLVLTLGSLIVAWRLDASAVHAVWALSLTTALCYAANWEACRRTVVGTSARRSDPSS